MKETEIHFKALSEGLGFHPFSDGLPYAPLTKKPRDLSKGDGAIAAGPPRMVFPKTVPAARLSPSLTAIANPVSAPLAPSLQLEARPQIEWYTFSYSLSRAMAYALDLVFNLCLLLGSFSFLGGRQYKDALSDFRLILILSGFLWVSHWLLIVTQEILFQTSVGKALFGLRLRGSFFQIFFRACFFLMSLGFAGLGIFAALFDSKKRCWHDRLCRLQPTYAEQDTSF